MTKCNVTAFYVASPAVRPCQLLYTTFAKMIAPALLRALEDYNPNATYKGSSRPRITSSTGEQFYGKVGSSYSIALCK